MMPERKMLNLENLNLGFFLLLMGKLIQVLMLQKINSKEVCISQQSKMNIHIIQGTKIIDLESAL